MQFFSCRVAARLLKGFWKKSSMEMSSSYFTFCHHRSGCRWGASHAKLVAVSKTFLLEGTKKHLGLLLAISVGIFTILGEIQLSCERSLDTNGCFGERRMLLGGCQEMRKGGSKEVAGAAYCLPHKIRLLKKPKTFKEGESIWIKIRAGFLGQSSCAKISLEAGDF